MNLTLQNADWTVDNKLERPWAADSARSPLRSTHPTFRPASLRFPLVTRPAHMRCWQRKTIYRGRAGHSDITNHQVALRVNCFTLFNCNISWKSNAKNRVKILRLVPKILNVVMGVSADTTVGKCGCTKCLRTSRVNENIIEHFPENASVKEFGKSVNIR